MTPIPIKSWLFWIGNGFMFSAAVTRLREEEQVLTTSKGRHIYRLCILSVHENGWGRGKLGSLELLGAGQGSHADHLAEDLGPSGDLGASPRWFLPYLYHLSYNPLVCKSHFLGTIRETLCESRNGALVASRTDENLFLYQVWTCLFLQESPSKSIFLLMLGDGAAHR